MGPASSGQGQWGLLQVGFHLCRHWSIGLYFQSGERIRSGQSLSSQDLTEPPLAAQALLPHPYGAVVRTGRPWPSRGELGSGSKGEVGVRTAVGWVLSVPWSPPTGPGLGDRAEKVLDACSPGPPNNFLGHVFRVSSSPQPLTITPGGGDGGAGVMEHSSS